MWVHWGETERFLKANKLLLALLALIYYSIKKNTWLTLKQDTERLKNRMNTFDVLPVFPRQG